MQFRQLVGIILRLARRRRRGMALMVLLGVCSSLTESVGIALFLPFLQAVTNQNANAYRSVALFQFFPPSWFSGSSTGKLAVPFLIGLAMVLRGVLTYGSNVTNSWVKSRVAHDLRCETMDRVLAMDAAAFEREGASGLWNTLAIETTKCSEAVGVVCSLASGAGVVMVFGLFLCLTSWQLTLAALASVLVVSAALRWVSRRTAYWSARTVETSVAAAEALMDNLGGLREIQAFSLQGLRDRLFTERSRLGRQVLFRLEAVSGLTSPVSESIYAMLLVLIFLLAVNQPSQLPKVVLFLMVLFRLQPNVRGLEVQRSGLFTLAGAVGEVDRFLNRPGPPAWTGTAVPKFTQEIRFEDVSFAYNATDAPALRQVSLCIPKGKITAIVGSSGAGKTTLIQLLLGFRRCTGGRITIDGAPLETLDLEAWRRLVGTAFQDAYLFGVTIAENIRYGRYDATHQEVQAAARLAHAEEIINALPDGYQTKLVEGVNTLSGGQRQRLALARALLRRPQLLILDEATNALDSLVESTIQERIGALEDMTLIIIAHRFSALRRADYIVVMDNGLVVEQGTPDQLLQRDGLFAQMNRLQTGVSIVG